MHTQHPIQRSLLGLSLLFFLHCDGGPRPGPESDPAQVAALEEAPQWSTERTGAVHPGLEQAVAHIEECRSLVETMNQCYLRRLADDRREQSLADLKQAMVSWRAAGDEPAIAAARAACRKQRADLAEVLRRAGCAS